MLVGGGAVNDQHARSEAARERGARLCAHAAILIERGERLRHESAALCWELAQRREEAEQRQDRQRPD